MKNKKKILFITVLILVLVIVVTAIIVTINIKKTKKLTYELETLTTNYYENEFTEYMPTLLKRNGTLKITVSSLKQLKKDVSIFEDNDCDLEDTYVVLTYNEKTNYDIESHLSCK